MLGNGIGVVNQGYYEMLTKETQQYVLRSEEGWE